MCPSPKPCEGSRTPRTEITNVQSTGTHERRPARAPAPPPPTERVEDDDTGLARDVSRNLPRDAVHDRAATRDAPKAKPNRGKLPGATQDKGKSDPFAPNGEPRPSRFHVPDERTRSSIEATQKEKPLHFCRGFFKW